jgi:hypothetical protein
VRAATLLLIGCLAGAALPAQAEIYRWQDAQGGVHYGNVPPHDAARLTRIQGGPEAPRPLPAERRLPPAPAASGPTTFPGTVDEATVARAGQSLARRSDPASSIVAVGPAMSAPRQLSSLQVP